jgi:hypothetical protein
MTWDEHDDPIEGATAHSTILKVPDTSEKGCGGKLLEVLTSMMGDARLGYLVTSVSIAKRPLEAKDNWNYKQFRFGGSTTA